MRAADIRVHAVADELEAWRRVRRLEDLQARWGSAAALLVASLDAGDDLSLLDRFVAQVRRIASDVERLEPEFAAGWAFALPLRIGAAIAAEVLEARGCRDPQDELLGSLGRLLLEERSA